MACRSRHYLEAWSALILLCACESADPAPACTQFIDINVVPMDSNRMLEHQMVRIRGNSIDYVGAQDGEPPGRDCTVIHGEHRYLIPGLTDSHVHLPLNGAADQQLVLQMLLANGITTAINMEGSPEIVVLRDRISRHELVAPRLYTTGPFIQQPAFMTAEEVTNAVIAQKQLGYDFIKVHGDLTSEAYDALFRTARSEHIRVVGHVPANLGLEAALGRQSLIVHAEEYIYSYFEFNRPLPTDPQEIQRMVAKAARETAQSGTWVSPTLSVFEQIINQAADIDVVLRRPQMQFMPRRLTTGEAVGATQFGWYPPDNPYVKRWPPERLPLLRSEYAIMLQLVRALRDAGVPLLAGTDPFVPCVVPGFSMKDEFEQLYAAGLTPYEVLKSATWNAATFLGLQASSGSIAAGKSADLVLLTANPLLDVDNVFLQAGVMLRGQWLPTDELQAQLRAQLISSAPGPHPAERSPPQRGDGLH